MESLSKRTLYPGVYAPLPTFFDDNEDLDYESYKKHLLNLTTKGMIPVCAGSLGEAVHLTFDERASLIRFIRKTLDESGLQNTPIVAGVGGSSTRETKQLAKSAAEAGANAGMVILPAYYAASLNADTNQVIQYFVDICEASPIPLLLYNFPANAAGQDMSSDTIGAIMEQAPNLCGVKLTCGGSVGKLIRLQGISKTSAFRDERKAPFLFLDGLIGDLTPWMRCGGHGTVSGIPNFAPVASMRLWELLNKPVLSESESKEAAKIQEILSRADARAVPGGVRAMKYALNKLHGYGRTPRRPLLPLQEQDGENFMMAIEEMLRLEDELAGGGL